jgi:hypothetical protein
MAEWIRMHQDDPHRAYAFPDPTTEEVDGAMHTARYDLAHLTQAQAYLLCDIACAYDHLLTHPAGTEAVVRQLREVRREIRRRQCTTPE